MPNACVRQVIAAPLGYLTMIEAQRSTGAGPAVPSRAGRQFWDVPQLREALRRRFVRVWRSVRVVAKRCRSRDQLEPGKVRLGSRLGSRLRRYMTVQIETAWNTRPLGFQVFTNGFDL